MRPNPLADVLSFLFSPGWPTAVFWLLLAGGFGLAWLDLRRFPGQRTPRDGGRFLLRLLVGCMWWQQSLWKIPPDYGGLQHWMQEMVDHASTGLQSSLVRDYVLPNIAVFGPLVYAVEVSIGVSLMLGLFTRAFSFLGALMAINLWLGLYSAPGEWPWTYFFLIVIQSLFVIDPPGLSLGADLLVARRGFPLRRALAG